MTDIIHAHSHGQTKPWLELKNVSINYGKEKIINNLSLKINENSFVAIMGTNGCGKTTIIRAIMGLIPYQGQILLQGQDISKYPKKELAKLMAYVPQLFANKGEVSVYDYISFGRFPYSGSFLLTKKDKAIINRVIKSLKLEKLKHKFLNQISGGQRQKVALAAALAQETEIIILDEPTTYLDLRNQFEILEIMHLLHLQGKTVLVVLHDLNQAIKYVDSVILLHQKKLFMHAGPHQVLSATNINKVYNVDAIMDKINGKNHIIDIDAQKIMEEIKWF